ncbi:MAG: FAD-dependent oxidoreductase, partial [Dehalococcoidia bacterium]|nr:FAD-dependent oxidoreductase [Dehalococcoidia bacterium]
MKNVINETINTDVLIIGGGIAGCLAAIKARETGLDVTIVDKANVGRSGTSHQMSGVLTYFDPEADDAGKWYEECIQAGEGLCDMERLRGMVEETADRVRDLEAWGVRFLKEKGKFIRKAGVGHLHAGNVILENGGFQLMSVIRGEVLRRGVRLIERVMVTDLLTSDGELPTRGKVTGAVGFGVRTGKSYLFTAGSTVITSGCTRAVDLTTAPMSSLSGDGRAMAFRAGCEMRNIELTHFSPGPTRFMCAPGLNILFGEGAIMTNARGERFMRNRDTVRIERAPRSVLSKAMALEMLEGRGPVFMDATRLDEASHRRIEMALPIVTMSFARGGLSLRKDKIEYDMRLTDLGPGGIRADSSGATCIPGLYAAGAASDHGEDGVSNVIGHGMESCIGGWRAGKGASEFSLRGEKPGFKEKQASELIEKTFKPL